MQVSKVNDYSPFTLSTVCKTKLKIIQFILNDLAISDLRIWPAADSAMNVITIIVIAWVIAIPLKYSYVERLELKLWCTYF